jgi:hypothetical protein
MIKGSRLNGSKQCPNSISSSFSHESKIWYVTVVLEYLTSTPETWLSNCVDVRYASRQDIPLCSLPTNAPPSVHTFIRIPENGQFNSDNRQAVHIKCRRLCFSKQVQTQWPPQKTKNAHEIYIRIFQSEKELDGWDCYQVWPHRAIVSVV